MNNAMLRRPLCIVVAALILLLVTGARAEDRVLPLEGQWVSGQIESIENGTVRLAGGRSFELQRLQRIERTTKTPPPAPYAEIRLIDGSLLRASDVLMDREGCTAQILGSRLKLPLASVRGIRLAQIDPAKIDTPVAEYEKALATPAKTDALFVRVEGQTQVVEGGLEAIDATQVTFSWSGTARKLARTKAYGVVLASVTTTPDLSGLCQVQLLDGSTIWGRLKSLNAGKLTLTAHGQDFVMLWNHIAQVRVRSDRVTFLCDIDPVQVVEEPIVAFAGPWQRDRNVLGKPLKLGDTVYERGLGVHSRCLLTYDCGGQYAAFHAIIGIDAQTKGKGDCVFKVIGDGKELFSRQVKGADKPQPVRLEIKGVQRLTLAVEPGEDLDLSDHGNWCEARLEKADKP